MSPNESARRQRRSRPGLMRRLCRFHRDQKGATIDYVLILGVFCVPIIVLLFKLFEVLADYFGMIAFYVSWPFL